MTPQGCCWCPRWVLGSHPAGSRGAEHGVTAACAASPGVTRELGHRCHRGTWLLWGGFVLGAGRRWPQGSGSALGVPGAAQRPPPALGLQLCQCGGTQLIPTPSNPLMALVPFPQSKGDGPVQPGDTSTGEQDSTRCAPRGRAAPLGGLQGPPVPPPDQGSAASASLQIPPGAPSHRTRR